MNDAFGRPQNVAVIGGTSDIALATLRRLVPGVQRLALTTRDPAVAEVAASNLGIAEVACLELDLIELDRLDAVVDEMSNWLGSIDLALLAAGDLGEPYSLDIDTAEVARLGVVNHAATTALAHRLARSLHEQGHGTLAVITSIAAVRPRKANLPYAAAKAGLDGFATGLDDTLAGSGARVMVVRPGFVRTKMTASLPEQPLAVDADEVAAAIVRGLARGRRSVWVPATLGPGSIAIRALPRSVWRRVSDR